MDKFTAKELESALKVITSTIKNCENQQPKFQEGTSQHTLLKNRIKALYISKALIENKNIYSKEELTDALEPVKSIIRKCEKAQVKSKEGTSSYTRLKNIIDAMYISKALILDACENIT